MYIVDSNCFIKNARSYNPMGIALSLWKKVTDLSNSSLFFSIDKVKAELVGSKDELSAWAKALSGDFFKVTGNAELRPYIEQIVPWAAGSGYKQAAKDRFLQADYADPFLVAYAMAHENVVDVQCGLHEIFFDMSRYRPNRTIICHIVKELIGCQPKAA